MWPAARPPGTPRSAPCIGHASTRRVHWAPGRRRPHFPSREPISASALGGYLYAFGGDSGAVAPNDGSLSGSTIADVAYAQIDLRTGDLTSVGWTTNSNKLKKAVSKHTAVMAGGNVLVTAGLYNGAATGSTEESYASSTATAPWLASTARPARTRSRL